MLLSSVLVAVVLLQAGVLCRKRHYAVDLETVAQWNVENALKKPPTGNISAFTVEEERKINYSAAFPFPVKNKTVKKIKGLGNGSFGDVFLASLSGSKEVAIKLSARVKYAKSEYNSLRKLDSRYFPAVYFFGLMKCGYGGTVTFFAMEYIKGKDAFQHLVDVDRPFEGEALRYIVAQLLVSITLVHSKGLFHRDIKPENIMLDRNMNLKLVDFGGVVIAKNDNAMVSSWFGTPNFMAPEVKVCFQRETDDCYATRLADWWSAGATIYYLATFHDYKGKHKNVVAGNADLTALIHQLCTKDPKARKINYKKHAYFAGFDWKKTDERYFSNFK